MNNIIIVKTHVTNFNRSICCEMRLNVGYKSCLPVLYIYMFSYNYGQYTFIIRDVLLGLVLCPNVKVINWSKSPNGRDVTKRAIIIDANSVVSGRKYDITKVVTSCPFRVLSMKVRLSSSG